MIDLFEKVKVDEEINSFGLRLVGSDLTLGDLIY